MSPHGRRSCPTTSLRSALDLFMPTSISEKWMLAWCSRSTFRTFSFSPSMAKRSCAEWEPEEGCGVATVIAKPARKKPASKSIALDGLVSIAAFDSVGPRTAIYSRLRAFISCFTFDKRPMISGRRMVVTSACTAIASTTTVSTMTLDTIHFGS